MWSQDTILDFFKGGFSYYLLFAFPLMFIISPVPIMASVEFPVFRLQQFELHGIPYGSQNILVNMEARTLSSGSVGRRCIIVRIEEFSASIYQQLVTQGAASLLILLPSNMGNLSMEEKKRIWDLEETMLETETQMAVYLSYENLELTEIYSSVQAFTNTDSANSAAAALIKSLSSDGYQLVASGIQNKPLQDMTISSIHGHLTGQGLVERLPTIAIVAHYDAFAAAPELAFGADSNGSGVVALLELARILSKLYSSPKTRPKMNIVFLLSGGGYINYQGTKRFLEDQLDATDSSLLSEPLFTLCLDTIANGDTMYMHVSRKPKEGSHAHKFFQKLEEVGSYYDVPVEMVHRKINLQDDRQSWEHEKFSIRRLPAFTLSRLGNPNDGSRGRLTDTQQALNMASLQRHVSLVVETVVTYLYNRSPDDLMDKNMAVTDKSVGSWMKMLTVQPRSPQLMATKSSPIVNTLYNVLNRYVGEAHISSHSADRRDPEWAFFDGSRATMSAYAVKPATFDLLVSLAVAAYLGFVYFLVMSFPSIVSILNATKKKIRH